jgi:hypothetical protein
MEQRGCGSMQMALSAHVRYGPARMHSLVQSLVVRSPLSRVASLFVSNEVCSPMCVVPLARIAIAPFGLGHALRLVALGDASLALPVSFN